MQYITLKAIFYAWNDGEARLLRSCDDGHRKPFQCWGYFRPLAQGCKDFWKPSKPWHVGIHWKALAECSQMSTHIMQRSQLFIRLFASFWEAQHLGSCDELVTVSPSNDEDAFVQSKKDAKIFENHRNHVMLVLIGWLLVSTLRWAPMCQGFSHVSVVFASFCISQISHQQHKGKPFHC